MKISQIAPPKTELILQRAPSELKKLTLALLFFYSLLGLMVLTFAFLLYFGVVENKIFTLFTFIVLVGLFLISLVLFQYKVHVVSSSEVLMLDKKGICYYSGLPTWMQALFQSNKDWKISWKNIHQIQVKRHLSYELIKLTFQLKYNKRIYETPIFQWVDGELLDDTHIRYPLLPLLRLRPIKNDEFYEILNQTPLFYYFVQHQIKVKLSPPLTYFQKLQQFPMTLIIILMGELDDLSVEISKPSQNPYLVYNYYITFIYLLIFIFAANQFKNMLEKPIVNRPPTVTVSVPSTIPAQKHYVVPDKLKATWNTLENKRISFTRREFNRPSNNVMSIAISPDGSYVASATEDFIVRLWDFTTGKIIHQFKGHTDKVHTVIFHPKQKLLASASEDDTIRLWNLKTYKVEKVLHGHKSGISFYNGIYDIAFSSGGHFLASASWDDSVRVWNLITDTRQWLGTRSDGGHEDSVHTVAFSPDDRLLASGGFDNTVRLWDADTGKLLSVLRGHEDWILDVAFSPDSKLLASASVDNSIRIWELTTAKTIRVINGHNANVTSVIFIKNSNVLISASNDRLIRYWEVSTGGLISTLRGHTDYVNTIALASNGKILLSGSGDETIKIWIVQE